MERLAQARGFWWCFWPIMAGLFVLLTFQTVGETFLEGYLLDLGSTLLMTPRHTYFLALWSFFGAIAAGLIGVGIARLMSREGWVTWLGTGESISSDRLWIILGMLGGLLIPLAIRTFILRDAPLTDDEGGYRFMAELLASGRLRVESHPLKIFFDRAFMINNDHLYAQYFLGWPALMVPGLWLGNTGIMNAVYSALTVLAVFQVLRRLVGGHWAKLGIPLYLSSPMLMVSAATEMSNTTCLMALVWMSWCFLRSQDDETPWWSHTGVAFFFSMAFFIRPTSALGIGLPILVWWALSLRRLAGQQLASRFGAFFIPALLLGALFLLVNKIQNGSFTTVGYQRLLSYLQENDFRFTGWTEADLDNIFFRFDHPWKALARTAIGLFRFNFALFGWPYSLLFLWWAGTSGWTRLWWFSLLTYGLAHLFVDDPGIDSFGPHHYFEIAWPVLLLTVLGLRSLTEKLRVLTPALKPSAPMIQCLQPALLPVAAMVALILLNLSGYAPVRLGALGRIADNINMPREAVAQAGLHNAVVFAPWPFILNCRSAPTQHFVYWHPGNDPDLTNDVLWVNHISLEQNRQLMGYFPGRQGYIMVWTKNCTVELLPLDELQPGSIPDAYLGGIKKGPA